MEKRLQSKALVTCHKISKIKAKDQSARVSFTESADHVTAFQCVICCQQLTRPRDLPCYHTMCERCLLEHIVSLKPEAEDEYMTSFPCPVCSLTVLPPKPGLSVEDWSTTFNLNRQVVTLMETLTFQKNGSRNCDSCTRVAEISEAKHWCKECSETFCSSCISFHNRMKASCHHEVALLSDVVETPSLIVDVDEPCHLHPGKSFEVYCSDHNTMCCVLCLATQHRECKHIRTIEESAKEFAEKRMTNSFSLCLREIQQSSLSLLRHKKRNIDQLDKDHSKSLHRALAVIIDAKNKLDSLYSNFKKSLEDVRQMQKDKLQQERDHLLKFQKSVEQNSKLIEVLAKFASPTQIFVTSEKMKSQIMNHHRIIAKEVTDSETFKIEFSPSPIFEDMLKSVSSIGEVSIASFPPTAGYLRKITDLVRSVREDRQLIPRSLSIQNFSGSSIPRIPKTPTRSNNKYAPPKNAFAADVVRTGIIPAKTKSDSRDCWFRGGLILENGNILLADFYNKKLKLFTESGLLIKETSFDTAPRVICRGFRPNAVIVSTDKTLMTSEISDTQISEPHVILRRSNGIHGVTTTRNNIIITIQNRLEILEKDGTKVREIVKEVSSSAFLASGPSNQIYYSDSNALVCCGTDGIKLFDYRGEDLKDVKGIAVDHAGNVYVCCGGKHHVYQINSDGSKGRILIKGFKYPHALAFSAKGDRFFVTTSLGGSHGNRVELFQLFDE